MADEQQEKSQGPADPSGPGGIDAPTPPGGPQRTDAPSGGRTPGEAAADPEPDEEPTADNEDNKIPPPTSSEPTQSEAARALQEENAESSLDTPSQ